MADVECPYGAASSNVGVGEIKRSVGVLKTNSWTSGAGCSDRPSVDRSPQKIYGVKLAVIGRQMEETGANGDGNILDQQSQWCWRAEAR